MTMGGTNGRGESVSPADYHVSSTVIDISKCVHTSLRTQIQIYDTSRGDGNRITQDVYTMGPLPIPHSLAKTSQNATPGHGDRHGDHLNKGATVQRVIFGPKSYWNIGNIVVSPGWLSPFSCRVDTWCNGVEQATLAYSEVERLDVDPA